MRRPSADLTDPSRNLEESVGSPSSNMDAADVDLSMPPTSDDDIEDADDGRIFTPPPHIAARFYRPSQARRKDSAASSRRNSISSAHSRCSSTQAFNRHGAPQSKQIAQHLRRTSFLEDRKARLADRAAHAEKVRLRAAMAKATHRDTSLSEERALAAQQAREKNLAEIVASCAEEVKRAKAVAETMKDKRERELVKLRIQMEERLAEAERRRVELKNRNATKRARGQSLMSRKPTETSSNAAESDDTPLLSEHDAAARLQWWWKGLMRKKAVAEFSELGLTIEGVRDTSFDEVLELLGQEKVLVRTARVLRICGLQEGETGSVDEMAAVRTFLSAFLILGHPTQVLSNKDGTGDREQVGSSQPQPLPRNDLANPQLQDLVTKARDLLISFENIMSRLTAANNCTPPPTLRIALPEIYATFYNAFLAWKSRDSESLVQLMLLQFVELDMILQTVQESTDDAAAEQYRESIKSNQVQLIVRIKKLAGQERGKKMIADAVRKARKARAAKKPTGDMKPRVAENAAGEASATAESLVSPELQTLTPPPTPAKGHTNPQPIEMKPGFSGLLPDNRIVVHELAINREYRIPASEYREHRTALQIPLFAGMRASMEEDNLGASFGYFIVMMRYFKDNLQRLVKAGAYMHNTIGEILDTEVAERQFQIGSFSYEKFFVSMASLLPKLCAPFRDDEVKDLVDNKLQNGSLVDRVEALTEFVDLMLCDYVNYMFSTAAPQLIESAPEYEKRRFAAALETGQHGLDAAEVAWRAARSKVLAEARKRDPEGINHPRSRPTDDKIYAQLLVDCFTQPAPIAVGTVPEMLGLDYKRMTRLSLASQRIVTTGAILLQCKNLLKRDVRTPWKTEATRITAVLEADHENMGSIVQGVMAALEGGRSMPAATKTHLKALVTKVLNASQDSMRKSVEPTEPVLRLLLARLRGHMNTRLTAGSAKEKLNAATTAHEKLAGLGLAEFAVQVREMLDEISKVGAVDRAAHGSWWNQVAAKVAAEDGAGNGSPS
ncbi:IQ calmodulin-binding domain-containing family protein [Colletotrichum graminicola]|uniref:IQ calmodulin-binding domain-containing family protein n=1 Tax=Colletotrichum graminicola (strain M1.001 / M2 / FGSC 10212) TaxID=645133 RepID=E3QK07_COLGM|nr:IQ calmodulin-binding domain-containing family protein [Colletotrichum graminicola M1.001]EFQ31195.1 IQ calmodulin-binding domain-containing family protein [Colletotrichum graminicola M1.001]WDK10541.1 IQ calmodulin-binding domain-containing family protein [Colletotrichum graminicola]